jgi:enamine deaminase RidA (YjgF/YER057c/UK114 family)
LTEASSARPLASARFINPETVHPPFGYSHVVEVTAGRPVYIAGAGFEQVVKLNLYLVDATHLPVIREVPDQYVNTGQPPASTAVEVRRLFREDALIEVEAVAVIASTEPSGR